MTLPDAVAALIICVPLCAALIYGIHWEAKAMKSKQAKEAALEKMYIALAEKLAIPGSEVTKDE